MEKLNKFQKIINKIYYLLFVENFKGKLKFNLPLNYGRIELIDYLIKKNIYFGIANITFPYRKFVPMKLEY